MEEDITARILALPRIRLLNRSTKQIVEALGHKRVTNNDLLYLESVLASLGLTKRRLFRQGEYVSVWYSEIMPLGRPKKRK